jgi:thymidylate synthase
MKANKNDLHESGRPLTKEEFISKIKTDPEFAKYWGELGPIYGHQWRKWNGIDRDAFFNSDNLEEKDRDARHGLFYKESEIDQIHDLIDNLKTNPDSRRLIVSAWNVGELDQMVLPPCHIFFQCYTYEMTEEERIKEWCDSLGKDITYANDIDVDYLDKLNFPKRKISLEWYQRSVDVGLGLGFNITSYGLLLHLLAKEVNMIPDELIFTGGDCHIYLNHIEGLKKQLEQESYPLPTLKLNNSSLEELKYEDVEIVGYKSSPSIKLELSN